MGEETGITELSFDWGDRFFETGPYSRGKVARYFIAATNQEEVEMGISPETGEPEHHEWRWVTFDEAYDLGSPRVRQIVQWARQNHRHLKRPGFVSRHLPARETRRCSP